MVIEYPRCEICRHQDWSHVYTDQIRDGKVGKYRPHSTVIECRNCSVWGLADYDIPCDSVVDIDEQYITGEYRNLLGQSLDWERAFVEQNRNYQDVYTVLGG